MRKKIQINSIWRLADRISIQRFSLQSWKIIQWLHIPFGTLPFIYAIFQAFISFVFRLLIFRKVALENFPTVLLTIIRSAWLKFVSALALVVYMGQARALAKKKK